MNTFWKIALGFILGVASTFGVFYIKSNNDNDISSNNKDYQQISDEEELRDEIRFQKFKNSRHSYRNVDFDENGESNNESFELSTKKGVVKLHTNMSKDSVKILMGMSESTSIDDSDINGEVIETWKYKGTNTYIDEFTIKFSNGKLKSVSQFKDH